MNNNLDLTKVFTFVTGKAVKALTQTVLNIGEKYDFSLFHSCVLSNETFPIAIDFEKAAEANVIVIQNTWGSTHPARLDLIRRDAQVNYYNSKFVEIAKSNNIPLIVIETGTYSRFIKNYNPQDLNLIQFYRMAKDHWIYGLAKWCVPQPHMDRTDHYQKLLHTFDIEKDIKTHQWRQKISRNAILILPGLEHDPTNNKSIPDWVDNAVTEIRKVSSRKIWIKPHPLSLLTFKDVYDKHENILLISPHNQLQKLYNDINVAVVDNSTSVFELIETGIPCFTSELSFGAELKNTDLATIETPTLVDNDEYIAWLAKMSYTEFNVQEFSNKHILVNLRELINS